MEKRDLVFALAIVMFVILIGFVFALNDTINQSANDTVVNQTVNETVNSNFTLNDTVNQTSTTNETGNVSVPDMEVTNFFPTEVKLGDVQFNIQILNNRNETLNSVMAFVTGEGFSTYNVVPANEIRAGEKDYIFVSGNLKDSGNISLKILINGETFYQNISVVDPDAGGSTLNLENQQEQAALIQNISQQLSVLKNNYNNLSSELDDKKSNNYDVSKISLSDFKTYLKNIQADILTNDVNSASVNLDLALSEYSDLNISLDSAKKISLSQRLKDNAVLFSTIAGALLTFFALYELVKKKGSVVKERVASKKTKTIKTYE